jgi:hypothetical protein
MSDKIKDKLRKLLNQKLGEEKLGNLAAAESFAAKIQELLIKHKLEFSEIESPEEERTNPIEMITIMPTAWGEEMLPKRVVWAEELGSIIAESLFCRCLALQDANCIMFVGRREDVKIAREVFVRIIKAGVSICETEIAKAVLAFRDGIDTLLWEGAGGNEDYRYSFFHGFNGAIRVRLVKNKARLLDQAGVGSTALVKATQEVDDWVTDKIKPDNVPPEDRYRQIRYDAFLKGNEHGSRVELSPDSANKPRAKGAIK